MSRLGSEFSCGRSIEEGLQGRFKLRPDTVRDFFELPDVNKMDVYAG